MQNRLDSWSNRGDPKPSSEQGWPVISHHKQTAVTALSQLPGKRRCSRRGHAGGAPQEPRLPCEPRRGWRRTRPAAVEGPALNGAARPRYRLPVPHSVPSGHLWTARRRRRHGRLRDASGRAIPCTAPRSEPWARPTGHRAPGTARRAPGTGQGPPGAAPAPRGARAAAPRPRRTRSTPGRPHRGPRLPRPSEGRARAPEAPLPPLGRARPFPRPGPARRAAPPPAAPAVPGSLAPRCAANAADPPRPRAPPHFRDTPGTSRYSAPRRRRASGRGPRADWPGGRARGRGGGAGPAGRGGTGAEPAGRGTRGSGPGERPRSQNGTSGAGRDRHRDREHYGM